jgi:hypothetical protein
VLSPHKRTLIGGRLQVSDKLAPVNGSWIMLQAIANAG